MTGCKTYGQRGVALIMALMLLLLLTALAAALVFVANMETAVNANYRREQVLYFAAKAGIEEARDRLLWTNATTLITPPQGTCAPAANCLPAVPAFPGPTTGNNVSHANNKTRRRFLPNLHYHRFWIESEKRWIRLRVSTQGMRLIDKLGIERVLADLRSRGAKI